jgi:ATP phosphoribosyltransferase
VTLNLAIPNKGRLHDTAIELLEQAGITLDTVRDRRLFAAAGNRDMHVYFVRADDVPGVVDDGVAHAGITGLDLVRESGVHVEELLDLGFAGCELVLAVPEESPVSVPEDVPPGSTIATSFPQLTKQFFDDVGVDVEVVTVSGAAEITPKVDVSDFITDLMSTGTTLAQNNLRPVATILESSAHLIADQTALDDAEVGSAIEDLRMALHSVVAAEDKRYVMANVPRDRLDKVHEILPGVSGPTIMDIDDSEMVATHAVVDEDRVYAAANRLKDVGGEGVLVLPIQRFLP